MNEKRMLIVDSEIAKKIEENRGDMSNSEFISYLIESQFKQEVAVTNNNHITKEEFRQFEEGIRELLRNFMEFFLSYGLELGKQTSDKEIDKLGQKLKAMGISSKSKSL
jgi:hypothetical protein